MFANRYTVFVDACSLASVWKRNILLSLAEYELFRLRWSQEVLNETERAIFKILAKKVNNENDVNNRAKSAVAAMNAAFPEALVEDYDGFLEMGNNLADKDDKHVLAAALKTQAQMLVTENLRHFPATILEPMNIEAKSADEFIADAIELDIALAIPALTKMRKRFNKPYLTADEMLTKMESVGLTITASTLRRYSSIL